MKAPHFFGRKVAELITLGMSILLVGGLAIYLLIDAREEVSTFVELKGEALIHKARKMKDYYVVPVKIQNLDNHAVSMVKVQIEINSPKASRVDEIEVQYLGRSSEQTYYVIIEEEPRNVEIKVKPLHYYFD